MKLLVAAWWVSFFACWWLHVFGIGDQKLLRWGMTSFLVVAILLSCLHFLDVNSQRLQKKDD